MDARTKALSAASVFCAGLLVTACASINSMPNTDGSAVGYSYYMPKRDFIGTVTVSDKKAITKVAFSESDYYPDLNKAYVLAYNRNLLSKNKIDIGVDVNGLLTSADTTLTSGVPDALKAIATAAGTIGAFGVESTPPACIVGDNSFLIPPPVDTGKYKLCGGVEIEVKRVLSKRSADQEGVKADEAKAGIYYRQNEPYQLKVITGVPGNSGAIKFSPTNSPIHLLPVAESFFANNTATFAFSSGIPTKYTIDSDGEITAALKIPADVINAYFAAIGAVFASFKTADTNQTEYLNAQLALQLTQKKYEECIEAIKAKNNDLLASLGCTSKP
jgi:hypothetical protein